MDDFALNVAGVAVGDIEHACIHLRVITLSAFLVMRVILRLTFIANPRGLAQRAVPAVCSEQAMLASFGFTCFALPFGNWSVRASDLLPVFAALATFTV